MKKFEINIGEYKIGDGHKCFLVAEVGTTCNGDLSITKELIDAAAAGGFNAIKFQTIWPDQISDKTVIYRYRTLRGWEEENMYEMFKQLTFTTDEWLEIASYARSRNIIFFSTIDYFEGVKMLEQCDVAVHKMGSWDITFEPLEKEIAKTGKPIMLDLGPATLTDIARFIEVYNENGSGQVILLHDFHTEDPIEMNMANIPYLKKIFGLPAGFSSPGLNHDLDIIAISLGASVIEKRLTLDRGSKGHHHVLSLEPLEIKPWIERIRFAEAALGCEEIIPSKSDIEDSKKYYRSICTKKSIKQGELFSMKNLDAKRPGTGISARFLDIFLGKKSNRDIEEDTLLTWEDL